MEKSTAHSGIVVHAGPVRRPGQKKRILLALFVLAASVLIVALSFAFFRPQATVYTLKSYDYAGAVRKTVSDTVQIAGTIGFSTVSNLSSASAGEVEYVGVSTGDTVEKGQVLVRLKSPELETALAADSDLLTRRIRERERVVFARQAEIEKNNRDLAAAQARRDRSQSSAGRIRALFEAGAATKQELDTAQDQFETASDAVDEASNRIAASAATYNFNLSNADLDIAQSQSKVESGRRAIEDLTIRSPFVGKVVGLQAAPGSYLTQRAPLVTLVDQSTPVLNLNVRENQVGRLRLGQAVSITVGTGNFAGMISKIDAQATGGSETSFSTVAVTVRFVEKPGGLLPGMSATVDIVLGSKEATLSIPRGPYLTGGNQNVLYKIEGNQAVKVTVAFGLQSPSDVEVTAGLHEGDQVIVSGYDDFISYERVNLEVAGGRKK